MSYTDILKKNLTDLAYPQAAIDYLVDVWGVIQLYDDARDGDPSKAEDVNAAVWATFVRIPANSFYQQFSGTLTNILGLQILKWLACNEIEGAGKASAKTYMWRAGFYDVVLAAGHLCGLEGIGPKVLAMYGESLDDYLGEFPHA